MTTNLILARDASVPPPILAIPTECTLHRVTDVSDEGFPLLDQVYADDGFPKDWATNMLARGAIAVVILVDRVPAGSALIIRKPCYVQEIRRTFDAGPEGDYYFGDFVLPAFRGRQIQRMLIRARLHISHQAGRRWAMAGTRASIPASLANYSLEGFCIASKLHARQFAGWQWEHHEVIDPTLPSGRLSRKGVALPGSHNLRRIP